MNPAKLAKPGNEDSHQAAVMCWAAKHKAAYPCLQWLFHVPNGGLRGKIEGARFKAIGVKSGVSDLLLLYPSRGYHGLCIEMKHDALGLSETAKAKMVSEEQNSFLTWQASCGYAGGVCFGWIEATNAIAWYLEMREW